MLCFCSLFLFIFVCLVFSENVYRDTWSVCFLFVCLCGGFTFASSLKDLKHKTKEPPPLSPASFSVSRGIDVPLDVVASITRQK